MLVTKLLISPVKKRIFCPKTTKFGPKLAFLVDMGLAMQVFLVPCWLVGWWLWRAGCISQDTYLLYGEFFGPFKKLENIKQTSWFTFCRGSRLTTPADWDIGRQPIKITLCQNRPNSNDGIFDSVSISFLSHPSEERGPGLY